MISQTAEYALRALVYLADQATPRTTAHIAQHAQIPPGYLAKVMQSLSRARLVLAQRGLNGGFTLATAPDQLSVLAVVNAVDPVRRFHTCPLGLHGIQLCPLHQALDDAARSLEETFGDTTIADLAAHSTSRRKTVCRFPLATASV